MVLGFSAYRLRRPSDERRPSEVRRPSGVRRPSDERRPSGIIIIKKEKAWMGKCVRQ